MIARVDRRMRAGLYPIRARSRSAENVHHVSSMDPPPHVAEEARRAYAQWRSITAEFCGDPPPGRSALDRLRKGNSNVD